jgi:hypothetical protein
LLLAYVALRKTSSSPSGHSRFPKNEHFIPAFTRGLAPPPVFSESLPRPSPIHEIRIAQAPTFLAPPNLINSLNTQQSIQVPSQ